ncbi:hypothetical protein E2C01_092957 [Portunus trituberculatus]|uniref:Uncharacterized protein n=1 Tax=Portunus trituberculatus TaxID=210409 RepID=A0A5B7JT97_PORTR|nr:hypothetical protein [Portunus trituberculatus]
MMLNEPPRTRSRGSPRVFLTGPPLGWTHVSA